MPTILIKKSDTPGAAPTGSDLTNLSGGAEIAVNTADKRVFSMNSSSAIIELGTNPGSLTTADASATVFRSGSATITNLLATSLTVSSGSTLNGGVVINELGADADTRIEGDTDANLFFVDASTDRVGFGTNTPTHRVQIDGAAPQLSISGTAGSGYRGLVLIDNNGTKFNFFVGAQNNVNDAFEITPSTAAGGTTFSSPAITVTSTGNVGVGTTSPASGVRLHVDASGGGTIRVTRLGSSATAYGQLENDGTNSTLTSTGALLFQTGSSPAERARITAGGYFKASNNGSYLSSTATYHEIYQSANNDALSVYSADNTTYNSDVLRVRCARITTNATYNMINSFNGNSSGQFIVRDSGNVLNTNNSYGQISDVKTKQDIVDAASQWDDIKSVRVRKFRFKNNPEGALQIGVVAQELEAVSPGLVDESPDYEEVEITNDEGNVTIERKPTGTSTKSVKYSVLYMKAIKALQEAMTRIEELEAKVAALEAK